MNNQTKEIHEECGVFGIWSPRNQNLAKLEYYGLTALQHRGQEAAGIAVNHDRVIQCYKNRGLVHEVFTAEKLEALGEGKISVGHVRYSTSGGDTRENAQPMLVQHVKGQLAICHNGNLVNSYELRRKLELEGCIFHTTSDTEVISYIITRERLHSGSIEKAVNQAMAKIDGAYSLLVMSPTKLIACRDPHGFKPLCYGVMDDGSYVFASESCALDAVGAKFVRDIEPGEIVMVNEDGFRVIDKHAADKRNLCIFEYIYFARPDSVIDGKSVHAFRIGAGEELAKEHPAEADLVIGVPDSGLDAAVGYSRASGIPYAMGLIKNKYIGRTFIAPDQTEREHLVRLKLNAISEVIKDKRVILIDDSIVRGTTSARIVKLVRDAGAREVHMRISSPTFLNPCYYGTDIDSREHLIACHHSIPEIAQIIGADSLGFLSVDAARNLARVASRGEAGDGFCCACFNGEYPTAVPEEGDKNRFDVKH